MSLPETIIVLLSFIFAFALRWYVSRDGHRNQYLWLPCSARMRVMTRRTEVHWSTCSDNMLCCFVSFNLCHGVILCHLICVIVLLRRQVKTRGHFVGSRRAVLPRSDWGHFKTGRLHLLFSRAVTKTEFACSLVNCWVRVKIVLEWLIDRLFWHLLWCIHSVHNHESNWCFRYIHWRFFTVSWTAFC